MTFRYVGVVFVVVSLLMAELATLKINDDAVGGLPRVQTLFGCTIALEGVVKRIRNNPKQFIIIAYPPNASSAR
jgi:hypothetical protein